MSSSIIRKAKRKPTTRSRTFVRDQKLAKKHAKDTIVAFKKLKKTRLDALAKEVKKESPGRDKKSKNARGRLFLKKLSSSLETSKYLDTYIGKLDSDPQVPTLRKKVIKAIRKGYLDAAYKLKDVVNAIATAAISAYQIKSLSESQSNLRESIPEAMRAFLPKTIIIMVDKDGVISKITDKFENQYETLDLKIKRQHILIRRYNKIAKKVKKDLKSSDEKTRLAALVLSIIMETGIRPGQSKNKTTQRIDGETIEIETFGATTLGPKHVSFVKDFAELEFVGKKGTVNTAQLSNSDVITLLKSYVEAAQQGKSKYIFVTKDGDRFGYSNLKTYFNHVLFKNLKITDFRKLKATETVLAMLHEEQKKLYQRISKFADIATDKLEERIAHEVASTINTAYLRAQKALSHEDVGTTIGSYVNPEVVLGFLSTGQVDRDLKVAVLQGKRKLSFNPQVFLEKALGGSKKQAVRTFRTIKASSLNLQELLDILEKDLEN